MTLDVYARLDEGDARFDGNIARKHLELNLGYRQRVLGDAAPRARAAFEAWHAGVATAVPLRGQTTILIPPGYDDR
jgi:hypothetical protein